MYRECASRLSGYMLQTLNLRRLAPRVRMQQRKQRKGIRSQSKTIYAFPLKE